MYKYHPQKTRLFFVALFFFITIPSFFLLMNAYENLRNEYYLILLGCVVFCTAAIGLWFIDRMFHTTYQNYQKQADFISAVSHEFKTPITAIMLNAEMLQENMIDGEIQKKKCYQRISDESQRLSRMIHNILDLTHLERNRWKIKKEEVLLAPFIQEQIQFLLPNIKVKGFELSLDFSDQKIRVLVDKDALKQIINNLIDNALKFSQFSETKKIRISIYKHRGESILTVRDYGPGVSPSELRKIFDTFYRVEKEIVRKTMGTGIGLSLVRHFCNQMNIKIQARNTIPGLEIRMVFKDGGI